MIVRDSDQRDANRWGREAGQRGQSPNDNPYPVASKHWTIWNDAWREADRERKQIEANARACYDARMRGRP